MNDEIVIMMDIYDDIINYIEHIKTSRTRMTNIKNRIQNFNNNYFDIKCNDELLNRYLNMFNDIQIYNELICDLEKLQNSIKDKIKNKCEHDWVNDTIDIDPDRSQNICYCVKCEITKK
jgi:hypothetical protein